LAPVRVNAITPGQIDTPLWRSRLSETEARAHFDRVAHAHPVGRVGTANDVAQAILFLMMNGFMTGAVLDIDGGWRGPAVSSRTEALVDAILAPFLGLTIDLAGTALAVTFQLLRNGTSCAKPATVARRSRLRVR